MASSQDYSSSPDDARMEIDLEARSEEDPGNTGGGSQNEVDFGSQYSPTNPTENSPSEFSRMARSGTPNRYSPTNPTDDIDYLEDVISRRDRSEPEDNSVPDNDGDGSVEGSPAGVLEVADDDDNQNDDDSDAENRLVIQEEPGEEMEGKEEGAEEVEGGVGEERDEMSDVEEEDKVGEEEEDAENEEKNEVSDVEGKDKVGEEEDADNSQGLANSQESAGQFEMTETFLDNLNPQDCSQEADDGEIEEGEEDKQSDAEQTEKRTGGGDASFPREKDDSPREASPLHEKQDAALPREEEEESSPAEEEKEVSSSREEEEGEVREEGEESSSPGVRSPASESGDNQGNYIASFLCVFCPSININQCFIFTSVHTKVMFDTHTKRAKKNTHTHLFIFFAALLKL